MKDTDFEKLIKLKVTNGVLIPLDYRGTEYAAANNGKEVYHLPATNRDLKFHACYFLFCSWMWDMMPTKFKLERCGDRADMYKYMKLVSGQYAVSMKYKNQEYIELKSISFGRMSEESFKEYVNEQIMQFYENILVPLGMESLLDQAHEEFTRLFNELI